MSTWNKYLGAWVVFGAYLVVVFALVFLQGLFDLNGLWPYLYSLPFFLVLHTVAVIGVFYILWRVFSPLPVKQAKLQGIPATAEVLEATRTKWRGRRFMGPWSREYRLKLQVAPPTGAPYEATTYAYFYADKEPRVGATIPVKIHPQRLKIVVVATPDQMEDKSWPKP